MEFLQAPMQAAVTWWVADAQTSRETEWYCETRDLFLARLPRVCMMTGISGAADTLPLYAAMLAEIGNNCFDHNLGQWRASPGCWFSHGVAEGVLWCVLADHGQGVRASLRHVLPNVQTDQEALDIAFARQISGRSPEQRGNGLKFVRSVINGGQPRALLCQSGSALVTFGKLSDAVRTAWSPFQQTRQLPQGTLTVIVWESHEA